MFAKRQSALAAAAGAAPRVRDGASLKPVVEALRKPPVAAGLAGLLLLGAGALFLTVLGDPNAGAPSAHVALERDKPAPAAPAPSGFEAFSMGAMGLYQNLAGGGDPAANGEAVITLPDGGSVSGSAPAAYTAPLHAASPLVKAPIAGLSQPGSNGPLPMIAPDGRVPAQAYARPFRPNGKPRVALIVGGLGLNAVTTRAAIERLPPEVTLSFVPYAENLQSWIDQAGPRAMRSCWKCRWSRPAIPTTIPAPIRCWPTAAPTTWRPRWIGC